MDLLQVRGPARFRHRVLRGPAVVAALPYIAAGAAVAGTGIAAYSAIDQANAQKAQGKYQAAVARNNQILADNAASVAIAKGNQMEAAKRTQTAQAISLQRAGAAASGIDANDGSALKVQSDTALLGETDALIIRDNAAREALGYKNQGLSYGAQAQLDESRASYAAEAGNLNAFGSIVGGASSVADKWARFKQVGAGSTGLGDD